MKQEDIELVIMYASSSVKCTWKSLVRIKLRFKYSLDADCDSVGESISMMRSTDSRKRIKNPRR